MGKWLVSTPFKCTSNSKLPAEGQVSRLPHLTLPTYFYSHGHELGIILACAFSYTPKLFLQAVLSLLRPLYSCLSYAVISPLSPPSIAVRSLYLAFLNFKVLSPNLFNKPALKICHSAISTWPAWPLWTIDYPFHQIRFWLPGFILRHLNYFFLQYTCFCLLNYDLLKAFRHFKMKDWISKSTDYKFPRRVAVSHSPHQEAPQSSLADTLQAPILGSPFSASVRSLASSPLPYRQQNSVPSSLPRKSAAVWKAGSPDSLILPTQIFRLFQLKVEQLERYKLWTDYKASETATDSQFQQRARAKCGSLPFRVFFSGF